MGWGFRWGSSISDLQHYLRLPLFVPLLPSFEAIQAYTTWYLPTFVCLYLYCQISYLFGSFFFFID